MTFLPSPHLRFSPFKLPYYLLQTEDTFISVNWVMASIIFIPSMYNILMHLRLDLIELWEKSNMQFNSKVTKKNLSEIVLQWIGEWNTN